MNVATALLAVLLAATPALALPGFLQFVDRSTQPPIDPEWLAVSPDGAHVYVVGNLEDSVAVYARDAVTGMLAFVAVERDGVDGVDGLDGARAVAVSPDGAHVYVAATDGDAVSVFARDGGTGELTFVEAEHEGVGGTTGLDGAFSVTVSPDGFHVYVASLTGNAVAAFARDVGTGGLTFVEAEVDGAGNANGLAGVLDVAVSPDGAHVYTTSLIDDAVTVFARDVGTGALDVIETLFDGTGGVDGLDNGESIVVAPDGRHVYAASSGDHAIAAFARDSGTGQLVLVQVARDGVGGIDGLGGVHAIAISPDGSSVFAAGSGDNAVVMFKRDPTTGLLAFVDVERNGVAGVAGLGGAEFVAVSPTGGHVYVASTADDALVVFRLGCGDGIVGGDEECDDGGRIAGDGCSDRCAIEICHGCTGEPSVCAPTPDGGPCEGECSTGGGCSAGACVGGTTLECGACESCDLTQGRCVAEVRTTCRRSLAPSSVVLKITNRFPIVDGRLLWKWVKGAPTVLDAFGNPVALDDYALCVFDRSGTEPALLFRAVAPAGGTCVSRPCWTSPVGEDYRYADAATTPDGLRSMFLDPGPKAAHAIVKARGALLGGRSFGLPETPVPTPLTVQLQASGGACVEARYEASGVLRNDRGVFRARAAE